MTHGHELGVGEDAGRRGGTGQRGLKGGNGTAVMALSIKYIFKKLANFCIAILILKMEENMQHFGHIMLYYFKKGKKEWKCRKQFVQCVEKVLLVISWVRSGS